MEKKAPYLTLIAFKKVLEVVPESHLIMVGGAVYNVCRKIARALNIDRSGVHRSGSRKEVVRPDARI